MGHHSLKKTRPAPLLVKHGIIAKSVCLDVDGIKPTKLMSTDAVLANQRIKMQKAMTSQTWPRTIQVLVQTQIFNPAETVDYAFPQPFDSPSHNMYLISPTLCQ
jgi:hypothetical protein